MPRGGSDVGAEFERRQVPDIARSRLTIRVAPDASVAGDAFAAGVGPASRRKFVIEEG